MERAGPGPGEMSPEAGTQNISCEELLSVPPSCFKNYLKQKCQPGGFQAGIQSYLGRADLSGTDLREDYGSDLCAVEGPGQRDSPDWFSLMSGNRSLTCLSVGTKRKVNGPSPKVVYFDMDLAQPGLRDQSSHPTLTRTLL